MTKKLTNEEFVYRAKNIHGNKYNYNKINYINIREKVLIHCNRCNFDFWQTPMKHLQGQGCPICGHKTGGALQRSNTQAFIKKAVIIHGNKYNYSKVHYITNTTPVDIFCNQCKRYFKQTPINHLTGKGCKKCSIQNAGKLRRLTKDEFIQRAKLLHADKYEYDKTKYDGMSVKVEIFCKKCKKYFWQKPDAHLKGKGCAKCSNNIAYTTEDFIKKARCLHNNQYNYDKVNYINNYTAICIKCNTCKKDFFQLPRNHLLKQGCPFCNKSKGELLIARWLDQHHIKYIRQHRFKECKHKRSLPFDFYLRDYDLCIEFQGQQHYSSKDFMFICHNKGSFSLQQKRDMIKKVFCKDNQIRLLEIKYNENIEEKLKNYFEKEFDSDF